MTDLDQQPNDPNGGDIAGNILETAAQNAPTEKSAKIFALSSAIARLGSLIFGKKRR